MLRASASVPPGKASRSHAWPVGLTVYIIGATALQARMAANVALCMAMNRVMNASFRLDTVGCSTIETRSIQSKGRPAEEAARSS